MLLLVLTPFTAAFILTLPESSGSDGFMAVYSRKKYKYTQIKKQMKCYGLNVNAKLLKMNWFHFSLLLSGPLMDSRRTAKIGPNSPALGRKHENVDREMCLTEQDTKETTKKDWRMCNDIQSTGIASFHENIRILTSVENKTAGFRLGSYHWGGMNTTFNVKIDVNVHKWASWTFTLPFWPFLLHYALTPTFGSLDLDLACWTGVRCWYYTLFPSCVIFIWQDVLTMIPEWATFFTL